MVDISNDHLANWLDGAARYFENRDTGGEDMAHWSNVFSAERCREAAKRLRLSAQQREPVVRVKELRWYPVDNRPATRAEALSAIGLYIVADLSGDGRFAVGLDNGACAAFLLDEAGDKQLRYATIDEAKSAAQADYEQRIMAAIDIAPQSDRQSSPSQKQVSETGKELLKNTEQPMNNADVSVGELALLGSIAKAMRAEHDAGDGHFSTAEVEFMERHVARFRIERLDRLASSGRR